MSIDAAERAEGNTSAFTKFAALAMCAAMFAAFMILSDELTALFKAQLSAFAAPAGTDPIWWRVAKSFTASGIANTLVVLAMVWMYTKIAGRRVRDLGFTHAGRLRAWIVVLVVGGALLLLQLRGPIGTVGGRFEPAAIYAALMIGTTAALSEELFFRAFLMDIANRGGIRLFWQILISMVLFGLAHLSYIPRDIYGWTVPVATGLVGGFWAWIYVWSNRSLWPIMVAHFVNDIVVLPAAFYLFATNPPA